MSLALLFRTKTDPFLWFTDGEVTQSDARVRQNAFQGRTITALGIVGLLLLALVVGPRLSARLPTQWPLKLTLILLITSLVWVLFTSVAKPLVQRMGLTRSPPLQSLKARAADYLLFASLVSPIVFFAYAMMRVTRWWWVLTWMAQAALLKLAQLSAWLLSRMKNDNNDGSADTEITSVVDSLAARAGVVAPAVRIIPGAYDSRRLGAAIHVLHNKSEIMMHESLLARPRASLLVAVAHELGHWRDRHDRLKAVAGTLSGLFEASGLYVAGTSRALLGLAGATNVQDPSSLPILTLAWLILSWVARIPILWLARIHERKADTFATQLLGKAIVSEGLRDLALAANRPLRLGALSYLRSSHPDASERLALVELVPEV